MWAMIPGRSPSVVAPQIGHAQLVVLDREGDDIVIEAGAAEGNAVFLLLSGQPIAEPIVGYGPFVMNSRAEIETAMSDFRTGKFGTMPSAAPHFPGR